MASAKGMSYMAIGGNMVIGGNMAIEGNLAMEGLALG